MKTAFVVAATTLAAGNGGIGRVARLSARALIEAGHPTDLLTLLDTPPLGFAGQKVRAMGGGKVAFAARCYASAAAGRLLLYDSAGPARAHPKIPWLKRRYALWIHGIEVWGVPSLRPDYAAAVRGADLVLVNSHHTLERARQAMGALSNARVCWLATEQNEAAEKVAGGGPPAALILSRIDADDSYKGHRALVAEWPRVTAAVPEARLIIAGGGSGLAELRAAAAASPAAANIDIRGVIPEAEIEGLWRQAGVFAMPSRGEGFGLVYIEAMRHGIPVIASVHDAGQEVNVDGETGFNVSLDRPSELGDRLIALLANADLRARMGEAGRMRWERHFRYAEFQTRFLKLIDGFANEIT